MEHAFAAPVNASSIHGEGRAARGMVEEARRQVATLVVADPTNVIFTSGATEAAAQALTADIRLNGERRSPSAFLVGATEHPCVLSGGQLAEIRQTIPVNGNGLIDIDALKDMIAGEAVPYVAVQLVNSETGVIQPVAEIASLVRAKGGYVLCDAVQAAGRIPLNINELGVDFLLLSAHKIGGAQGAGALVLGNSTLEPAPLLTGGAQENRRRAGTENVAAIAGFGVAAQEATAEADTMTYPAIAKLVVETTERHGLADRLHIFGKDEPRISNTTCFALEGLEAQTALIDFDLRGVAISSGSACSSGKVGASHVLAAMDVPAEIAKCALRISTGPTTCQADVQLFADVLDSIAAKTAARPFNPKTNAA
jgi:cysteine desulfurase